MAAASTTRPCAAAAVRESTTATERPEISAATAAFRYMAVNSAAGVIATGSPSASSIAARYSSGEGALDFTASPLANER